MAAGKALMTMSEALAVVQRIRGNGDVVISTMGAAREWQKLGTHPLDLVLVPSSMGQATSIGLGIAIAQPDRKVIVCNGDGSTLMNLGSFVTMSAENPRNLVVILLDNGVYEVTGGQSTPGTAGARDDKTDVDYAAVARACGFKSVHSFVNLAEWEHAARGILGATGPTFIALKVSADEEAGPPRFPGPAPARARALKAALTAP
jgi:phosphonopyruvate decarboxylase